MNERIPGFTSTGSKRPDALFGSDGFGSGTGLPSRMLRSAGCQVWDESAPSTPTTSWAWVPWPSVTPIQR